MKDRVALRWRSRARRRAMLAQGGARLVVIDVDGCLTDGRLYVDQLGVKPMKAFGLDDHAAIKRWKFHYDIEIVTSDEQPISRHRARHMDCSITHAPADGAGRIEVLQKLRQSDDLRDTVYIGDGYHDADVFTGGVGFGIAPADAWPETLRFADAVTSRDGGRRAVAQALDFVSLRLR